VTLTEKEFEDILQRNKNVSSGAIMRAVQDASEGLSLSFICGFCCPTVDSDSIVRLCMWGVIGSRPSDHYFRSVCLSVCLFVQSFSQPSLIRFRSN